MQAETHERLEKGDDKICTRGSGGEEGKQVCIMTTLHVLGIVYTIPNILLLIANENKPYFGGKAVDHNME